MTDAEPLFETVLGADWRFLPPELRTFHSVEDAAIWRGEASVERGGSGLARAACALAGFPRSVDRCQVEVVITRTRFSETWTRRFGESEFRSYLSADRTNAPALLERFGAMSFRIGLHVREDALHFPVEAGRVFYLPLPNFLLPKSDTREFVDAQGRACFDVAVSLPLAGPIVRYQGWLLPTSRGALPMRQSSV